MQLTVDQWVTGALTGIEQDDHTNMAFVEAMEEYITALVQSNPELKAKLEVGGHATVVDALVKDARLISTRIIKDGSELCACVPVSMPLLAHST